LTKKIKSKNKEITFSDYVINRLQSFGVKHVFTITGGGIMYLVDAIARSNLSLISVHHEMFGGVAADAYARITKKIGVAIRTTGPGLSNLFTSVLAAYQDSSPTLFLGVQVKSEDSSRIQNLNIRQNGTFEFDSINSYKPITKFAEIVTSFEDGIIKLETALHHMKDGRQGPALLEIPLDIQGSKMSEVDILNVLNKSTPDKSRIEPSVNHNLAKYLNKLSKYKKPLIVLGNGVNIAKDTQYLKKFIKVNNFPYVSSCLSKESEAINPKTYIGVIGLRGNRSANIASQEADFILFLGTSLHQQVVGWDASKFNPQAFKLWCEVDREIIKSRKKLLKISKVFNISVEEVNASMQGMKVEINLRWKKYCDYLKNEFEVHIHRNESNNSLYQYLEVINDFRSRFSLVCVDAGLPWYVVPQVIHFEKNRRFISSGSFGSMGMALSYALGGMLALKNIKKAAVIIGDGSIMSCIQELATLRENSINATIFIINNNGYRSIRATHDKFFDGLKIGTDNSNGVFIPDFKLIARAFEIPHKKIKNCKELYKYLEKNSNENLEIVELHSDINQISEPMVTSVLASDGKFYTPDLSRMQPEIKYLNYVNFKVSQ